MKFVACQNSRLEPIFPCMVQDANGSKAPFFGFGGGARLCPGMDLARAELCVFLHHLVMKFE